MAPGAALDWASTASPPNERGVFDGKDKGAGKERETKQTVSEQVETVIKAAVNVDALSQMYEGWSAWV